MPKKKELKPATIARSGVEIPLYQLGDGRVAYSDRFGGPRQVRKFRDEASARADAEKLILRWMSGEAMREDLSVAEVKAFRHAEEACAQFELPLSVAIDEWAHVKKITAGHDLTEVVRRGMTLSVVPQITVNGILNEMLARKRRRAVKYFRMRDLENDLQRFARAGFGNRVIAEITTPELDNYLDGFGFGPRRRNNVRAVLVTLFRYAKTNGGYLVEPLGETAAEKLEKSIVPKGTITTYTPAEMRWWLENIDDSWLPWLACVAFAGVRTEEISAELKNEKDQIKWEDFRWAKGYINIRPEVSKVGERRLCPIPDNLMSWLEPYKDRTGYVITPGRREDNEVRRMNRLSARLTKTFDEDGKCVHPCPGLKWKHNAHRHSYGSYRQAVIHNLGQLSEEMGNSIPMLKRCYRDAKEEGEAREYFSIFRGGVTPGNLVRIEREGAGTDWNKNIVSIVPQSSHVQRSA